MTAMPALANVDPSVDSAVLPAVNDSLRLLTCGSVDDGKSTLIGRMLWDATDLYDDQRELLAKTRTKVGDIDQPDFSRLVDGLAAEREQGITIDIAWRYVDAHGRRYVIIDSPGHEQYTRNMASGASHADVAIMLTDARHGVKRQTRRHSAILDLMGVKRVILAVNKMDLVDWCQDRFRHIEGEFRTLTERFGFVDALAIPVCSLTGDNVVARSKKMPWYEGPTLFELLQSIPSRGAAAQEASGPFRMPVQMVLRDGQDFRGLAGTITSGKIAVGDDIVDTASGRRARVKSIVTMDRPYEEAGKGQAVVLALDTDIDVARGDVLATPGRAPSLASRIDANLVWLSETPYDCRAGYLLRTATDLIPVDRFQVTALLDLETLAAQPSDYSCSMNDLALAEIELGRATAIDTFGTAAGTGCFMVVDALTGASVAGGVVTDVKQSSSDLDDPVFVLDQAKLASGVCRDLGDSVEDRAEFDRRAQEVAVLLKAAGVRVKIDL